MPKRPNPPDQSPKDDGKKPRIGSSGAAEVEPSPTAKQRAKNSSAAVSPIATTANSSNPISGNTPKLATPPVAIASPKTHTNGRPRRSGVGTPFSNRNKGSNGESYLRSVSDANVDKNDKNELSPVVPPSTKGVDAVPPSQHQSMNPTPKDKAFSPNGPSKESLSKPTPKKKVIGIFFAILSVMLNIGAATYILYTKSLQSLDEQRCHLEVDKTKEELSKSQEMVAILRSGMDATKRRVTFLEQAFESMKKSSEDGNSDEKLDIMTEEDRIQWLGKMRVMEGEQKRLRMESQRKLHELSATVSN